LRADASTQTDAVQRGSTLHPCWPPTTENQTHVHADRHRLPLREEGGGIATRDEKGRVKLNQLLNTTAAGAAGGSFWGLLIGLIFLNPLLGVVAGAAGGAISGALTDVGINDKFMKELGSALKPGDAALFVLVQDMTADKVLGEIKEHGGVVLHTSLDETREKVLRDALAAASAAEPQA
jgi:uncharacterized membrane protein